MRNWLGRYYLLEVPALKFYTTFFNAMLFFVSLTFMSQPAAEILHGSDLSILGPAFRTFGTRNVILLHQCWGISNLAMEIVQYGLSKWSQVIDMQQELSRLHLLKAATSFWNLLTGFDDFIDFCDIVGPLFAVIALDLAHEISSKQGPVSRTTLQRAIQAPDDAQGCPKDRPASASQPDGQKWPNLAGRCFEYRPTSVPKSKGK